jgi:carboxylesterase
VDLTSVARCNSERSPLHLHGGRHGVLLFHGLSSTAAELNYLARGLNRAGYTVRVPVIQGYSHRSAALKKSGHRDWLAAALQAFDEMRAQCSTVSVGGLCIGSLLALCVSAERPSLTSAMLGLSTTLHYDGWANPWTRHLLPIFRYLPVGGGIRIREREPFGIKDERMRAFVAAQMRASGASDAGAAQLRVRDLLEAQRLAGVVRRSLHAVTSPTLLIHAKEDESASPRSSFEVAKGVGSQHVRLVLLSNSYHMISIDRERARVLSEMKVFLAAHLGPEAPKESDRDSASSEAPKAVGQAGGA